ncbi:hypothetical protein ILX21_004931 [Salmonella enterica]|nr:hypothetical protein [Salmonella enterica]EHS2125798.1 hypothetical protein [Salmonella enterica]
MKVGKAVLSASIPTLILPQMVTVQLLCWFSPLVVVVGMVVEALLPA